VIVVTIELMRRQTDLLLLVKGGVAAKRAHGITLAAARVGEVANRSIADSEWSIHCVLLVCLLACLLLNVDLGLASCLALLFLYIYIYIY
jgi:hypothetical protein